MRVPPQLLLTLAVRSVWAHKVKSLIVGSILFFGTWLVVVGMALLDTVQGTMAQSITSSMAGHIQIYSSEAEDELALFGSMVMGSPDNGEIDNFAEQVMPLAEVENVAEIVPMGITTATVFGPSELDRVLQQLRVAVERDDQQTVTSAISQLRRIARTLLGEQESALKAIADQESTLADIELLGQVDSDAFWTERFLADPAGMVDWLEANIARIAGDGSMLFLRVVGSDTAQFQRSFDRFYIVDGEAIPAGQRGFLFSKRTYERIVKNKVARELDDIYEEVTVKGKTIASDPLLQNQIERNSRQYTRVTFGLTAEDAEVITKALKVEVPDADGDIDALMQAFLLIDDASLERRYKLFYDVVAPRVRLYELPVGSVIPLRTYTKSGYARSINVKVYGTYEFKGLEDSDLASASNLTDLVTFRSLYGKMTNEQLAELSAIKDDVGIAEVNREDAEAALFGGGAIEEVVTQVGSFEIEDGTLGNSGALDERTYTPDEIQQGLIINAAVLLKDPDRLQETMQALQDRITVDGRKLQVVDWRTASGMVGQFLFVVQGVLLIALMVIFLVALLIINNSMVMATMDRVGEIGTMRAIGARRGLVVGLFLAETLLLALLAGAAGAAAGLGTVAWMGDVGIPAVEDVLVLLFAGPRLYPEVGVGHLVLGVSTVLVVSGISTLYPAFLAARIPPVVAMQGKE